MWKTAAPGQPQSRVAAGDLPSLREWKSRAEEEYVRRVMTVSAGDARRAAGVAGISRGHWYELVKKYHP